MPSYEVVDFLSWLSESRHGHFVDTQDWHHLEHLARRYLHESRADEGHDALPEVLYVFQTCRMIEEQDVRAQMKHFASCGACFHHDPRLNDRDLTLHHVWKRPLHPLLSGFIAFCRKNSNYGPLLNPVRTQRIREYIDRPVVRVLDVSLREYIGEVGPVLLAAFEDYLRVCDEVLISDYQNAEKSDRGRYGGAEHSRPLGVDESPEIAAERLAASVRDLVEGHTAPPPGVVHLLRALGMVSEDVAQMAEFLSWLGERLKKEEREVPVPAVVITDLVAEFCQETQSGESDHLAREIVAWMVSGDENSLLNGARRRLPSQSSRATDPISRYFHVPFHAMFVFLSFDDFPAFFEKYGPDLHGLTGDHMDIYYAREDSETRSTGHFIRRQLKSVQLTANALPALILWRERLRDACVIRLAGLSHKKIYFLMQEIVAMVEARSSLTDICTRAAAASDSARAERGRVTVQHIQHIHDGEFYGPVGVGFSVDTINQYIGRLEGSGKVDVAQALRAITEAVATSEDLTKDDREIVLQQLEEIGKQAAKPPEERLNRGTLGGIVAIMGQTLTAGGSLAAIWATWGPNILHYFGL